MTDGLTYKVALDLLAAAGDSAVKLTDGIKHMVTTGLAGYNYVAAKKTHDRLVDLSARLTILMYRHQGKFALSIDEYLGKSNPTPYDWNLITKGIAEIVEKITELLDDVQKERSDFVLESAYGQLSASLSSRAGLLQMMSQLPQPVTEEERESLRKINEQYKKLLLNFKDAIDQLNLYLKK